MEKREIIFLHFTLTGNMIIPIQIKPYDEIYVIWYKKQPQKKSVCKEVHSKSLAIKWNPDK